MHKIAALRTLVSAGVSVYPNHELHQSLTQTKLSSEGGVMSTARAILATGRDYNQRQAFDELMDVAKRRHLSVVSTAQQLLGAVDGTTTDTSRFMARIIAHAHPSAGRPVDGEAIPGVTEIRIMLLSNLFRALTTLRFGVTIR
jgi:hypothetical protein